MFFWTEEVAVIKKKLSMVFLTIFFLSSALISAAQNPQAQASDEQKILQSFHSISSHTLLGYVQELVSEKYTGDRHQGIQCQRGMDGVAF
jgi:hypothetical protein